MSTTIFNYDAALAAVKDNADAKAFLDKYRAKLEAFGTEAGQAALEDLVSLFASGKNLQAWQKFFTNNGTNPAWSTLAQGAAEDVANTAAMAQRWANFGAFIQECGVVATKMLLAILVAGFCG